MKIEKYGIDSVSDRYLFALELETPEEMQNFKLPTKHFASLIAWDSDSIEADKISHLLNCLFESGAAYICCWGKGCERVHDIADQIDVEAKIGVDSEDVVMTTWHDNELLSDALWFLLSSTWPDQYAEKTMGSTIAISIGNPTYAEEMRSALGDPRAFTQWVLDNEKAPYNKRMQSDAAEPRR